jgi:predicted alpha/beta hydrolase
MSSLPITPLRSARLPVSQPVAEPQTDAASDADAAGSRWQDVQLRCSDGRLITGRWAEPPIGQPVRAIAVIGPATAVAARYYTGFAEWLANRGYAVLSFDLRGMGASRDALHPREDVRLRDWARLDMGAALHAAARRRRIEQAQQAQPVGLLWIGHSLGGNATPLVPGFDEEVDALLGVAAQVASYRYWSGWARVQAWDFFHLMLPFCGHVLGRAPGRMLGPRAQDLPAGAALEWAAWGRMRAFHFSDPSLRGQHRAAEFRGTAHLWDIADDHLFGPSPAVDALAREFKGARVQRHSISPEALGVRRIEHFGPFRRDIGAQLWPRFLEPIERATPSLAARFHCA